MPAMTRKLFAPALALLALTACPKVEPSAPDASADEQGASETATDSTGSANEVPFAALLPDDVKSPVVVLSVGGHWMCCKTNADGTHECKPAKDNNLGNCSEDYPLFGWCRNWVEDESGGGRCVPPE
jgi:hypothetical protein